MQYNYPRGEEHGYRFTTAFTFSVRTPKKGLSDCYWHEPIDCCGEGEHYTCTVKARSVGVWRQISDMASFWIRPEYVVDYRPILDAPVDAAGEVVEEIMLYCCWCILWCRNSVIIALLVALYFFVVAHFLKPSIFLSHLWKLLKEEMHPSLGFLFGVLLRCSSTVAVLLGSPAPLCNVAPGDFTYLFTYLPFACLLLIADCDADSAHVLPRGLLTCRTVRCNLHAWDRVEDRLSYVEPNWRKTDPWFLGCIPFRWRLHINPPTHVENLLCVCMCWRSERVDL